VMTFHSREAGPGGKKKTVFLTRKKKRDTLDEELNAEQNISLRQRGVIGKVEKVYFWMGHAESWRKQLAAGHELDRKVGGRKGHKAK